MEKISKEYHIFDKIIFYVDPKMFNDDNIFVSTVEMFGGTVKMIDTTVDNLDVILPSNYNLGNIYYIGTGSINDLMLSQYVKVITVNGVNESLMHSAHYTSIYNFGESYFIDALNLVISDITTLYTTTQEDPVLGICQPISLTKIISTIKLSKLRVYNPELYENILSLDNTIIEHLKVSRIEFCSYINATSDNYTISNAEYSPITKLTLGNFFEKVSMETKQQNVEI